MPATLASHGLTQERLRQVLSYDPESGVFVWLVSTSNRVRAGERAGYAGTDGRRQISVDGHLYASAWLAWLYMTGCSPISIIDHKDTNPGNDAWSNLRQVRPVVNQQNRRKAQANNKTGLLGVSFNRRRGHYVAQICPPGRGRNLYLGSFATAEEAHAAYVAAKRQLHEGCTL